MNFYLRFIVTAAFTSMAASHGLVQVRSAAADVALGDILKPVLDLDCKKGNDSVQMLCGLVAKEIYGPLVSTSIGADPFTTLFTYNDTTKRNISTGSSCAMTADITSINVSVKLLSSVRLDFSVKPVNLSDPIVFAAEAQGRLSARSAIQQHFGFSLPFVGCRNYDTSTLNVTGSNTINVRLAIFFNVAPSLSTDPSGNFVLTIRPITKVAAQLSIIDANFKVTGGSFWRGLLTTVLGHLTWIDDFTRSFLKADVVGVVWNNIGGLLKEAAGIWMMLPDSVVGKLVETLRKSYLRVS